jgi:hypothetical protein
MKGVNSQCKQALGTIQAFVQVPLEECEGDSLISSQKTIPGSE